ncbi:sugar-phosphatase [Shouchella shacheensis]|uniref:sugar-phosphatase n=1 Tax=Shouchella shacheensis TaxID=1649580 RepID=UPI00073FD2AD|nr:sugar-phosphatase [Shouchella shacheensis]
MYKLIAIDMDGTLLNDQHEVTNEVKDALREAKSQGVNVVLCTGRPIGGVRSYLDDLNLTEEGDFVIAYNGALVQNSYSGEVVLSHSLTHKELKEIYELSLTLKTPMHYFDSENVYTPNRHISPYTVYESYVTGVPLTYQTVEETPHDIAIPKIMFVDESEKLDQAMKALPASYKETYMMVKSAPFFLEILHPEVSKGNAVRHLAEKLGYGREEVLAIGDNGNDLTMVEYAGCGVAMANAIPELKEIADAHTGSNNENGVAHAIRDLALKPV